ncbi:hypothetical protein fh0823_06420 [Francisella halioticida]|nr:hypothetical protein fh0823_06420 [Francisella halioticida]
MYFILTNKLITIDITKHILKYKGIPLINLVTLICELAKQIEIEQKNKNKIFFIFKC